MSIQRERLRERLREVGRQSRSFGALADGKGAIQAQAAGEFRLRDQGRFDDQTGFLLIGVDMHTGSGRTGPE